MINSTRKSLLLRSVSAAMVSGLLLVSADLSAQSGAANQTTSDSNTQLDHNIGQPNSFGDDASSVERAVDDGLSSNPSTNIPEDNSDLNWQDRLDSERANDSSISDANEPAIIEERSVTSGQPIDDSSFDSDRVSDSTQPGTIGSSETHSGHVVRLNDGQSQLQEVPVNSLVDRKVVNLQDKEIGEVSGVVQSEDGAGGLLVEAGGFLGLGKKEVVVPLDSVRLSGDQLIWDTQLDASEIRDSQEFKYDQDRFSAVADE